MSDGSDGARPGPGARASGSGDTGPWAPVPVIEELGEAECLWLVSQNQVGRIAYSGRYGPTVLPVNYRLHEGSVVFRTGVDSAMDADLRTGISDADYKVAFEVDEINAELREGWSVLIQGPAHHVEPGAGREAAERAGVEPWPGGEKELYIRITPSRVTGRRIRRAGPPVSGQE
jgi:nitroimidazol reductase NimA-like FMN-containing flavoprotein (pyridoxamine 5'-phosphate oxidase superfamily)